MIMLKRLSSRASGFAVLLALLTHPVTPGDAQTSRTDKSSERKPTSGTSSQVIIWNFDGSKGTPMATDEILIPVPSEEPYQRVVWSVSGVVSQRIVDAEG
jgi:hypothetical protein